MIQSVQRRQPAVLARKRQNLLQCLDNEAFYPAPPLFALFLGRIPVAARGQQNVPPHVEKSSLKVLRYARIIIAERAEHRSDTLLLEVQGQFAAEQEIA